MINKIYNNLLKKYGQPDIYWPQWCASKKSKPEREKIIIGMILVQRTSWHNANIALKRLKKEKLLSIEKISETDLTKLTEIVRPAGFWQSKPQRLVDVCKYVVKNGGVDKLAQKEINVIRKELLEIRGVGPETADTILLYALDKAVFIIDEYTRRWVEKHELIDRNLKYEKLQKFIEDNLIKDVKTYQDLHALIIVSLRGREKK